MILLRSSHRQLATLASPTVATIGNFDGFHLGHQEIGHYVLQEASRLQAKSLCITFEPSPKEYFAGEQSPARIYPLREKFIQAREFGFDYFVCLHFNHTFSSLAAVDFVKQILHASLRIKTLVVGDDFKFGYQRSGNIELLHSMGETLGFQVRSQSTIVHDNARISSTIIRDALAESRFDDAATLMGRPFAMSGRVFHGDKKARTIGFPTANILLHRRKSPITGVFTVTASNNDKTWQGVANIGTRPTVNGQRQQLEVHLFDCQQDLYGQRLEVQFHRKLRDEIKFPSFDALKQQIAIDVNNAKEFFSKRT